MSIYFICPDTDSAAGGIKQIYRQVDILNASGFDASVLHENPFFKCTWFKNDTKIVHSEKLFEDIRKQHKNFTKKKSLKKVIKTIKVGVLGVFENMGKKKSKALQVKLDDIFVFPEIYAFAASHIYAENRKVIYNQNCYYTFANLSLKTTIKLPYLDKNTITTIVASEEAVNYLGYVYPNINLFRIHYGIDERVFNYSFSKKRQIAYMPRKLHEDVIQVIGILKERALINSWEFIEINNMTETQVAEIFKESAIFLSFNHREGFGMPPAEAMACGCVVIGYTGFGGKEYFKEEFSYAIPERNVQAFVCKIEELILQYENDEKSFLYKGRQASNFILNEYAMEVEKRDIVNVWTRIINQ